LDARCPQKTVGSVDPASGWIHRMVFDNCIRVPDFDKRAR